MSDTTPRKGVAYHEAAHAFFKCRFGVQFTKAYIRECSDEKWCGRVDGVPERVDLERLSDSDLQDHITISLAGWAAERILGCDWGPLKRPLVNNPSWQRVKGDWEEAGNICESEAGLDMPYSKATLDLEGKLKQTQELLAETPVWKCVQAIADRLNEATELDAAEIHAIYRKYFPI